MARTVSELLSDYEQYLRIARQLCNETISQRLRYLRDWAAFLHGRDRSITDAAEQDALDWWEVLQVDRNYDGNTLRKCLTAVNGFYAWLTDRTDRRVINPFRSFHVRRSRTYRRPWASEEDVRRVLELPTLHSPAQVRNKALFAFLYSTGARIGSALGVDLDDLCPSDGTVLIRKGTKSGHAYTALLLDSAWEWVDRYIRSVRPVLATRESGRALWLGKHGRRLTRAVAYEAVRSLAERAQLHVRLTPHGIRKSAATHLLRAGADLTTIKEFLGHADARSTEHYLDWEHDRRIREAKTFHPLRKLVALHEESSPEGRTFRAQRGIMVVQ